MGGAKLASALAAFGERADLEGFEIGRLYVQVAGAMRQVDGCKLTFVRIAPHRTGGHSRPTATAS